MPQVTGLVGRFVPKVQAKTLLDIGVGDGETITSMLEFWGTPMVSCCDPEVVPRGDFQHHYERGMYHESPFYDQSFDIITSFDSLACYTKPDGEKILDHMVEKATKLVVIWTPDDYYPYPPFQSSWHPEDFLNRGFCLYKAVNIHQGPPIVASGLLAWKEK